MNDNISCRIPYRAPKSLFDASFLFTKLDSQLNEEEKECVICLRPIELSDHDGVSLPCFHKFHRECVLKALKMNPKCPTCRCQLSDPCGQSPSGNMYVSLQNFVCNGFEGKSDKTIIIRYEIPEGRQHKFHPTPGMKYHSICRYAYLPYTEDGRNLLKRLKYAFQHGLTFCIGTSMTTGRSNVITWSSIHHKTSVNGGAVNHGFPDINYFDNCNSELDALNVPSFDAL